MSLSDHMSIWYRGALLVFGLVSWAGVIAIGRRRCDACAAPCCRMAAIELARQVAGTDATARWTSRA